MSLFGLPSSGIHSNGYSLVRKLLRQDESELKRELLAPTRIYWPVIKELLKKEWVAGCAHITGGGFSNISRMNPTLDYHIHTTSEWKELPSSFQVIINRSQLEERELYKTFNMGIGMVLATDCPDKVEAHLIEKKEAFLRMGETGEGSGRVLLRGEAL